MIDPHIIRHIESGKELMPPTLSEHDRENIDAIMGGQGDWFSARLLRLIAKADYENRLLLGSVYPQHYAAFMAWYVDRPVPGVPE